MADFSLFNDVVKADRDDELPETAHLSKSWEARGKAPQGPCPSEHTVDKRRPSPAHPNT